MLWRLTNCRIIIIIINIIINQEGHPAKMSSGNVLHNYVGMPKSLIQIKTLKVVALMAV